MRMFHPLLVALLLTLTACAAVVSPPVDPGALRRDAMGLPWATVTGEGNVLSIAYPGERLFSPMAALPLAGGLEVLDPLAAYLLAHPEGTWEVLVRAQTGLGDEYDAELAARRADLLQRYFRHRGQPDQRLLVQPVAGAGPPLELILQVSSEESVFRSKE